MCDVSKGGGGGGVGGGGYPEKRTYDVSHGQNRYVRLPLREKSQPTLYRKSWVFSIGTPVSSQSEC